MGEIAEMMLDGTLCAGCGDKLYGEASGFPRYCSKTCARSSPVERCQVRQRGAHLADKKVVCVVCNRRFGATEALQQHVAVKHPTTDQARP